MMDKYIFFYAVDYFVNHTSLSVRLLYKKAIVRVKLIWMVAYND